MSGSCTPTLTILTCIIGMRTSSAVTSVSTNSASEVALRELILSLAGNVDLEHLVQRAAEASIAATRAFGAYIEAALGKDGRVEVIASAGDGTPRVGTTAPYPGSLTDALIKRGTPEVITDVSSIAERMAPYLAESCKECVGLIVPLVGESGVLGSLVLLQSSDEEHFAPHEIDRVVTIAHVTSIAIRRVEKGDREREAREEAARQARTESLLLEATAAVAAQVDVEMVVSEIARNALVALDAAGAFVERVDFDAGEAVVVGVAGERVPDVGASTSYEGSVVQQVMEDGRPQTVQDLGVPGRLVPRVLTTQCVGCPALVVPLMREETPGALFFIRSAGSPVFSEEEVTRASIFGELAGLAFRKAYLLRDAEQRRAEAEAAVRARDEMLAVVSHDLRNPVHTIAMSSALLDDEQVALTEEERRKQLQIIKRSAERMNRLIQDLLDVGRIESGRFTVRCACEDAARLAGEVCEAYRPIAEARNETLLCELSTEIPPIFVDRDRIMQLLGNFLDNAIKFSRERTEILLRVDCENDPDDPSRRGVRFSVRDQGPGISPESLPHVFERYWQERTTAHKGSGLGLAIAKGIATAHGGRVWAESSPGNGATFYLWLPVTDKCA
jgi:signal transduction histidine kinase